MALTTTAARGAITRATGAATTSVLIPTANLNVGEVAIGIYHTDNVSTTTGDSSTHGISDSKGNTWTKVFEKTYSLGTANDGVTLSFWYSVITTQILTTDTVTFTTTSGVTDAVGRLQMITKDANKGLEFISAFENVSGDNVSAVRSVTLTGLPSRQYVFLNTLVGEGNNLTGGTPQTSWTERYDARTASGTPADINLKTYNQVRLWTTSGDVTVSVTWQAFEMINSLVAIYEADIETINTSRFFLMF
jgi:hypothetical protein